MTEIELPLSVDKTGWADGPWMTEPDKLNWITKAGLDGMIIRNRMGALCGYVAVAEGHPYLRLTTPSAPHHRYTVGSPTPINAEGTSATPPNLGDQTMCGGSGLTADT